MASLLRWLIGLTKLIATCLPHHFVPQATVLCAHIAHAVHLLGDCIVAVAGTLMLNLQAFDVWTWLTVVLLVVAVYELVSLLVGTWRGLRAKWPQLRQALQDLLFRR